jgi:hypothetical protein
MYTLTHTAELSQDRAAQLKEAHEKNKALTESLNGHLQEKVGAPPPQLASSSVGAPCASAHIAAGPVGARGEGAIRAAPESQGRLRGADRRAQLDRASALLPKLHYGACVAVGIWSRESPVVHRSQ